MLLTTGAFLLMLALLVIVHELGHFFTARAFGVKVEEFGVGFPPRLFSVKRGDTRYSLNAIPLGGFVKLAGEENPGVPGSLAGKPRRVRVLVLAAGALMNAILPVLLFTVAFVLPRDIVVSQVMIEKVAPDSPAAAAGIREGDVILQVAGEPIRNTGELSRAIELNRGKEITLVVRQSDSSVATVNVIPRWQPPPGQGAVGINIKAVNPEIVKESYPLWQAIPLGFEECVQTYVLFKNAIISMVIGTTPVALAGPVGIAEITGEAARAGISPLLEFAAFLSINLAIVNILPLPALDGGRIAFVVLEWLRRGRRVSPRVEGIVHLIGFAMLMALMLAITYQDIIRIARGESLIP
ncbi:MAG: RIP metalloprotease RseP [Chloroflexi bacterium]|nr:RIP metalloprotease RseP [Chloroflexota bacterium]